MPNKVTNEQSMIDRITRLVEIKHIDVSVLSMETDIFIRQITLITTGKEVSLF